MQCTGLPFGMKVVMSGAEGQDELPCGILDVKRSLGKWPWLNFSNILGGFLIRARRFLIRSAGLCPHISTTTVIISLIIAAVPTVNLLSQGHSGRSW